MLLTGRQFELHVGETGGGGTGHTNGVPLNFTLLPAALKKANYKTVFFGKWHLGESMVAQYPYKRGFGHSLGYLGGQEDYFCHDVGAAWPNHNGSSTRHQHAPPSRASVYSGGGQVQCSARVPQFKNTSCQMYGF